MNNKIIGWNEYCKRFNELLLAICCNMKVHIEDVQTMIENIKFPEYDTYYNYEKYATIIITNAIDELIN